MRFTLSLITLLMVPFVAKGQMTSGEATQKTIFYNKGAMYVGKQTTDTQTEDVRLFVDGSMTFVDGSKVLQAGGTVLTGNFISGATTSGEHIFTRDPSSPNTVVPNHAIYFVNKFAAKSLIPTAGKPNPTATDSINFGLKQKQRIIMTSGNKSGNYIDMPSIVVKSGNYVAVDPTAAIRADLVTTQPGGLFSLEAKYKAGTGERTIDVASLLPRNTTPSNNTEYDFLNIVDQSASASNPSQWKYGYNMLDLQLYDINNAAATNTATTKGTDGNNITATYLTGFTPPYIMSSDYMFFQALLEPNGASLTSNKGPIVDPSEVLYPGKGYFIGMEVSDHDYDNIEGRDENNGVLRGNRAIGGYQFSRLFLSTKPNFNRFAQPTSTANLASQKAGVHNERFLDAKYVVDNGLGTSDGVQLTFNDGNDYQFVGNPYTSALDLTDIVSAAEGAGLQTTAFGNVSADYLPASSMIRNRYWVVNNAFINAVKKWDWDLERWKWQYKTSYYDAQQMGGTASPTGADDYTVAPMQLFMVQANPSQNYTFTLPFSKRVISNARMTKSAPLTSRNNELLIQAIDVESGQEDRMCVVLHEGANMGAIDSYDNSKGIYGLEENADDGNSKVKITKSTQDAMTGLVYTKSSEGKAMLTNVIPANTKQLGLFFVPPVAETREYEFIPNRLNTFSVVNEVWIEDTYTNSFEKLEEGQPYRFTAQPLTGEEITKNRFILHFGKVNNDIIGGDEKDITCYYNSSTLYISNLINKDINSDITIYDMQGRLMGKSKVKNTPEDQYAKPLAAGTYIVKITGARNFTTKFISLHN